MPLPVLELDDYAALLGIKVAERPLNPYQLLNMIPLDADRDRVRMALARQKLILEQKRNVADPEVWQSVLDELEAAAIVLLDPEQRAVVDASIKRRMAVLGSAARGDEAKSRSTADAGSVPCPACQRSNSIDRRFCGNCGHALWETCPQCSDEVAAHERYCGQCGLDVRSLAQEQTRQLQERLDSAAVLASEHRYDAALSALRGVAAIADPKLESWAAKAIAQIEEIQARQREALAEADAAKEQAKKLVQEQAFEWGVKVLETIPQPLRDTEATELLTKTQFAGKELTTLVAEIREAAQEGRTWELFPKIERVLALKPDHQAVLGLADQLRRKFVANVRQRLADERYADAAAALKQIPLSLRTDEVRELLDVASEMSALLGDLKQSPYATAQALALAQRLAKHVPDNEEITKLSQQLGERSAAPVSSPRLARPYWTKPRERSAVGPPVEWLGNFVRAQSAGAQAAQTLREHPGEFFVALGLALHGLDEAAIDISLMPQAKGSLLGRLASLPLLPRRVNAAWGIDLGGYALKAIKLVKDSGGNVKIESAHYILLSKPLAHPDAEGDRTAILSAALADFAGRADLKGARITGALSSHQVLGRFVDLPPLPAKKVAGAVEYEARHQIPIDLDELCWGWTELGECDPKLAGAAPRPVMVVAARQAHVAERLALFESVGIKLDALQSDCLALHNALRFELTGQQPAGKGSVAVLDVGADESKFVVSSPRSLWFRSFGLAGHSFTTALLQELRLTYDLAEELKRHPAKARRYYQFREALSPLLVQFAGEVDRSLASFRRQSPGANVERLFALGGGIQLHGLLRHCITGSAT